MKLRTNLFYYFLLLFKLFLSDKIFAENPENNGGWKLKSESSKGFNGPCNIERVDGAGLTQNEFLDNYANSKPVIIYNYKKNIEFRRRCEKNRMLADWRNAKVVLNSANTYSYKRVESTFGEYVEKYLSEQNINIPGNETLYLFGDIDPILWKPLLDAYKLPSWSLPNHEPALSFGIAGAGTGVPFHFHGPGFGEVIYGHKRWFLQPYEKRPNFNPDKSTLDWYLNFYSTLSDDQKPFECLLKSNELIYFPNKWWHATLNAETSVFISTFLSPISSSASNKKIEL